MIELFLLTDPSQIILWNSQAWTTLAVLAVLMVVNFYAIYMGLDSQIARVTLTLSAGKQDPWAVASRLGSRDHYSFSFIWPGIIGGWLGTIRLFDHTDFDWYLAEALTLWPDYGSIQLWLVNALLAVFLIGMAGFFVSIMRTLGKFGLIAVLFYGPAAFAALVCGILLGPVALVILGYINPGAPFRVLGSDFIELLRRLFREPFIRIKACPDR